MIKHNELIIDGVRTSSFPFKVIVHDSPSIALGEGKTALLEHGGISGAIVQTNKHRGLVKKTYSIYLVKPTEEQMNQFMSLFIREKFWLENERVKTTRLWCYKIDATDLEEVQPGLYMTKATFTCHPTKYFKTTDTQRLTRSGTLTVQGSAPDNPSFKTTTGKPVKWSGDFITVDPAKVKNVGVVLGQGIQSLEIETVWGWA